MIRSRSYQPNPNRSLWNAAHVRFRSLALDRGPRGCFSSSAVRLRTLVLGFIELTLGFFNQAACADSPALEPADPDRAAGSAGARICACEGPMIFDARTICLEPGHVRYHARP